MATSERIPPYSWGQDGKHVFLTFSVRADASDVKAVFTKEGEVRVDIKERGTGNAYVFDTVLYGPLNVDACQWDVKPSVVFMKLHKGREETWSSLRPRHMPKPPVEKIDWDRWNVDESSSDDDRDNLRAQAEEIYRNQKGGSDMGAGSGTDEIGNESDAAGNLRKMGKNVHEFGNMSDLAKMLNDPKHREEMEKRAKEMEEYEQSWPGRVEALMDKVYHNFPIDKWDMRLLFLILVYLWLAPFTKVEESFNIQATHDLIFHGVDINAYDHHEFPGVVPRTFLGPIILTLISSPLTIPLVYLGFSKLAILAAVRFTLGFWSFACLVFYRRAVEAKLGSNIGTTMMVLYCCQFHWLFYCTRTLPNVFALGLVTVALGYGFKDQYYKMFTVLTLAAVVFRSEVVLLIGTFALTTLAQRKTKIMILLPLGVLTALGGVAVSVLVDSVFWRRLLWPEGEVLYFNTVLNKSSEWGTSPFYWYFTSALPRLLNIGYPMAMLGAWAESRIRPFVAAVMGFLVLFSALPHKETRFVFYAVPVLNTAGSVGIIWLQRRLEKIAGVDKDREHAECAKHHDKDKKDIEPPQSTAVTIQKILAKRGIAVVMAAFILLSVIMLMTSSVNYPGGTALHYVHNYGTKHYKTLGANPSVHIDAFAAMNGISRFNERYPSEKWTYSKDESKDLDLSQFLYLVTEKESVDGFVKLRSIIGFDGMSLRPPFLKFRNKVHVHRRKGPNDE